MAVVKANAYGHGSVEVARHALEHGASELAVASVEEAVVLLKVGIKAPYPCAWFHPAELVKEAAAWNISLSAFQVDWIKEANEILENEADPLPAGVDINVDTGMGRLGVRTKEKLLAIVEALTASENLEWEGIFTHFSTADEPDTEATMIQHEKFISFLRFLKEQGFKLPDGAYEQYGRGDRFSGVQRLYDSLRHRNVWIISFRLYQAA